MKKHLLLAAATLLGFSSVFAQDTTPSDGSEKTLYEEWNFNTVYRARLNATYKYLYYNGTDIVAIDPKADTADLNLNPNDGAFTPDRLWYFKYAGEENGKMKVTMHVIACPDTEGVTLPSTQKAKSTISENPTEFYVVSNNDNRSQGGFSLQHTEDATCHVNSRDHYLSTWVNGSSQHDPGSEIHLYELNPEDFEAASWEKDGVIYSFDPELLKKAKDERTPENFRALFSTDGAKIVEVTFKYNTAFCGVLPNNATMKVSSDMSDMKFDETSVPAPDFFTVTGVKQGTDAYTFEVEGEWNFPFKLNRVFRADLRTSGERVKDGYDCTKWTVKDNTISTRKNANADVFSPENLFYFNGYRFNEDNRLVVTLHTIVLDLDDETKGYGYECAKDNGSKGSFSKNPTEWVVKTNSNGTDGISLQHPDNEIGHASDMTGVNGMAGTIGVWSHANSQNNDGTFIRFFDLTDSDSETTEWTNKDGKKVGLDSDLVKTAQNNPTPENVRKVFDPNNTTTQLGEINAEGGNAGMVYDLQGRRLAAPVRGINIIDGKKVLLNR